MTLKRSSRDYQTPKQPKYRWMTQNKKKLVTPNLKWNNTINRIIKFIKMSIWCIDQLLSQTWFIVLKMSWVYMFEMMTKCQTMWTFWKPFSMIHEVISMRNNLCSLHLCPLKKNHHNDKRGLDVDNWPWSTYGVVMADKKME